MCERLASRRSAAVLYRLFGTAVWRTLAVAIAAFAIARPALALVRPLGPEELLGRSRHVVSGEVVSLESYRGRFLDAGEAIFTDVTIRVLGAFQGGPFGGTVTVQVLGGRVGDDVEVCPDSPRYEVGERVLVFLREHNGRLWNTGWHRGKLRLGEAGPALGAPGETGSGAYRTIPGLVWPGGVAPYRVNPSFADVSVAGPPERQVEAIACAAAAWTDQTRADFRFEFQGTTAVARLDTLDGVNAVFASEEDGNEAYSTILFRVGREGGPPPAFDVVFYRSAAGRFLSWSALDEPPPGAFDIQGVATHELGHALGLDHTDIAEATLYPVLRGNGLALRTLHADDRSGVESIYGRRTEEEPSVALLGVAPAEGPAEGGTEVAIEGRNFTHKSDTRVWVGDLELPPASFEVESCGRLRIASMPPGDPGPVSIAVANALGSAVLAEAYRYLEVPEEPFVRGDANRDGTVDLADAIFLLRHLFSGGPGGACADARDANDDGSADVADAVTVLLYLFHPGATALPPPFPEEGFDPTEDGLTCRGRGPPA